jgi:hypothetical protein
LFVPFEGRWNQSKSLIGDPGGGRGKCAPANEVPLLLKIGQTSSALRYAYIACQADYGNPETLVHKARCHQAQGDPAAAWLSIYSCFHSHILKGFLDRETGRNEFEEKDVRPVYQELLQTVLELIVEKKGITDFKHGFTVPGFVLATVPFTFEYRPPGKVQAMQDRDGSGWHVCRPQGPSLPDLQNHTQL